MSDTMNPQTGNPATAEGGRVPFGGEAGSPWIPYGAGERIGANQSAPSKGVALGLNAIAEFVVRIPTGVTALVLHVGRIVKARRPWTGTDAVAPVTLDGWIEMDTATFTGVADDLFTLECRTRGDQVAAYVTGITGTVDAADSVMLWVRGAGQ